MQVTKRRVYVASSWRNDIQPVVVAACRAAGHEVYDFKNPRSGARGFHWSEVDKNWQSWDREMYRLALGHPLAEAGFASDWAAMQWADSCILVMPCGRSAHLEAGYFPGAGKRLVILLSDGEPELMYKLANRVALTVEEAVEALSVGDEPGTGEKYPAVKSDPELAEAFREAEEEREERIRTNPNNGRQGWWRVQGVRHSAYAQASTAREAIDKALAAGIVGDWEEPEATFWKEELPDVF